MLNAGNGPSPRPWVTEECPGREVVRPGAKRWTQGEVAGQRPDTELASTLEAPEKGEAKCGGGTPGVPFGAVEARTLVSSAGGREGGQGARRVPTGKRGHAAHQVAVPGSRAEAAAPCQVQVAATPGPV